jgi:hypothetical protein
MVRLTLLKSGDKLSGRRGSSSSLCLHLTALELLGALLAPTVTLAAGVNENSSPFSQFRP